MEVRPADGLGHRPRQARHGRHHAQNHCQIGNMGLALKLILDWLDESGGRAAASAGRQVQNLVGPAPLNPRRARASSGGATERMRAVHARFRDDLGFDASRSSSKARARPY